MPKKDPSRTFWNLPEPPWIIPEPSGTPLIAGKWGMPKKDPSGTFRNLPEPLLDPPQCQEVGNGQKGSFWNPPGSSQSLPEPSGTFLTSLDHPGASWILPEPSGTFQNPPDPPHRWQVGNSQRDPSRTFWNFSGAVRNLLEPSRTPLDSPLIAGKWGMPKRILLEPSGSFRNLPEPPWIIPEPPGSPRTLLDPSRTFQTPLIPGGILGVSLWQ
ncbi:PREDICTED: uncharacterized protein LOC108448905 [Corvus brachyrhynchos]|uniref:uncharacterized protein LOC108448905 n=1 Tax=Corvus brachyrhynchos TaxID=85066 RepID=UPI00081648F6|nr:PREDICTED: uncharacterized protein LOC108448905 [Corvus brachyrhynchos]